MRDDINAGAGLPDVGPARGGRGRGRGRGGRGAVAQGGQNEARPPPPAGLPSKPLRRTASQEDLRVQADVLAAVAAMANDPRTAGLLLEAQLSRLPELNAPLPAMVNARRALIERIHAAINPAPGPPLWEVLPFGSTVTRIDSPTSDLDLTIARRDDAPPILASPKPPPNVSDMRVLARLLRQARVDDVLPILRARVPIVKCSWASLVRADINFGELLGVENSRLIASYKDLCPTLRPLAVAVKLVLKTRGVSGDPAGQQGPPTLSSYTVVLMVISFLQSAGMLPNLQDADLIQRLGMPRRRVATRQGPGRRGSREMYTCDVTYMAEPPGWVAPPTPSLAVSFARFWAWLGAFDWLHRAVAVDLPGGAFDRDRAYQPPLTKAQAQAAKRRAAAAAKAAPVAPTALDVPEDALTPSPPQAKAAASGAGSLDEADLPTFLSEVQPEDWVGNPMIVKDPFLHHRSVRFRPRGVDRSIVLFSNTAKAIQPQTAKRIVQEARRAHHMLTLPGPIGLHQLCAM